MSLKPCCFQSSGGSSAHSQTALSYTCTDPDCAVIKKECAACRLSLICLAVQLSPQLRSLAESTWFPTLDLSRVFFCKVRLAQLLGFCVCFFSFRVLDSHCHKNHCFLYFVICSWFSFENKARYHHPIMLLLTPSLPIHLMRRCKR